MSIINSTTGHSQPQERKVAKILHIWMFVVTFAFALVFLALAMKDNMDPTDPTTPGPTNQATPSGASGTKNATPVPQGP